MIFEVECDKQTKQTHGQDAHTYCIIFIVLDTDVIYQNLSLCYEDGE